MTLTRPPWWSPDFVLAELAEGRTVADLIREATALYPAGPVDATYRQDIFVWRKGDPAFRDAYDAAIGRDDQKAAGRPEEFGPLQQEEFLAEMARNGGNMRAAAYDCGFSPGAILMRINPKGRDFDPDFVERYQRVMGDRHSQLIEKFWDRALGTDAEKASDWLLQKLAEAQLPHLFNAKKTVEHEGTISHLHGVLPAGVMRQLAVQQRALEVHEAPVIDVPSRVLPAEAKG